MSDKLSVPTESLPGGGLTPASTPKTGAEALEFARAHKVAQVDLKFVDLPGQWQHFTVPINMFSEDAFTEGVGFDGSSIRGFQAIQESDMLLFPDPATSVIDPFSTTVPTLSMICNVKDPVTGSSYSRDPRYVAQKAEEYLKGTGLADGAFFGQRPSSSSLTRFASIRTSTAVITSSIAMKVYGTVVARTMASQTWGIAHATRKAISQWPRWIRSRTCAHR